jgi:ABC-type transport system involved in cytochrome c biogenesis permease component
MPFLPIVERELRVAARRPSTSLARFLVALVGIILWLGLAATSHRHPPAYIGELLFNILALLLFVWCVCAGVFLTADCLSVEKREGTLGLLFLTDLKGYDIVLGKLASTSLKGSSALIAALPVLALPLLLGGVTGAEFWRVVLTLLTTLSLSLASGLFMSAVTRESRSAMGGTFLWLLFVTAVLPLACHVIFDPPTPAYARQWCLWPSPAFLLQRAEGLPEFWPSFFVHMGVIFALLGAACIALARSWRDRRGSLKVRRVRASLRDFGNPYAWLARRGQPPLWLVWGLVIFGGLTSIGLMIDAHLSRAALIARAGWSFAAGVLAAFAAHQLFKYMVVAEASRCFSEDRRNGTMEMLMVSPISPAAIIDGQRRALAALFRRPAWTLIALNLFLIFSHYLTRPFGPEFELWIVALGGGMMLLLADYYGLSWTAMWLGLRCRRHHRAVLGTLLRIMLPLWIVGFLLFVGLFRGLLGFEEMIICWTFLGAGLSLMTGHFAQAELRRHFRSISRGDYPLRASICRDDLPEPQTELLKVMSGAPDKTAVR